MSQLSLQLKDLQYVILPCSGILPNEYKELYQSAYQLWHEIWGPELQKLDNIKHLYSNEFTRHHFFGCTFLKKEAIGLYCFSIIDLTLSSIQNDSWFNPWPTEKLKELSEGAKYGIMPAWLSVSKKYRRSNSQQDLNIALIQTELCIRKNYELNAETLFGTARVERGVDKICRKLGGTSQGIIPYRKGAVELFTFSYENIKEAHKKYSFAQNYLWKNKLDPMNTIEKYTRRINDETSKIRKHN